MAQMLFNHKQSVWLNLNSNDREELKQLFLDYQIDREIIDYSLDKYESAHLEYDKSSKTFVMIFNVLDQNKIDNHYETIPMTFIIKEQTIMTITNEKNQYIYSEMKKWLERTRNVTPFQFLFNALFIITAQFFPCVEEMNRERIVVSNNLKKQTSKKNLLALSDLETGNLFFLSASKQNAVLLEQIKRHSLYKFFSDDEQEELEDAFVEAKQLVEMTQLASQILQQLASTYNNVLNNSLNDTMRILTVLSVLLTIPTIITGFFGMNMPLPLEHSPFGWLITITLSLVLWFFLAFLLRKLMKR
jgi:Mg2+ and Co2+ transporter CorA